MTGTKLAQTVLNTTEALVKKLVLSFILFGLSSLAFSEVTMALEGKFIFGTSAFIDEDIPFDHSIIGGSIPIGVSDNLSLEPQFLYMKGPRVRSGFNFDWKCYLQSRYQRKI